MEYFGHCGTPLLPLAVQTLSWVLTLSGSPTYQYIKATPHSPANFLCLTPSSNNNSTLPSRRRCCFFCYYFHVLRQSIADSTKLGAGPAASIIDKFWISTPLSHIPPPSFA
ncbi:hypothetical protein FRC18_007707 [Serendipita sp. 400]|nr:hypothetical protein FRC18_007707 [Serendipita sp. 400]